MLPAVNRLLFTRGGWVLFFGIDPADHGEEEPCGPSAHQDAGEGFNGSYDASAWWENEVAVAGGRIGDCAEVDGIGQVGYGVLDLVERGPESDLNQVAEDHAGGHGDEEEAQVDEAVEPPVWLAKPADGEGDPDCVDDDAEGHEGCTDEELVEHGVRWKGDKKTRRVCRRVW